MAHTYTYTRTHEEDGWTVTDEERTTQLADGQAAGLDERLTRQGWEASGFQGDYTYRHPGHPGSLITLTNMYAPDYYAN